MSCAKSRSSRIRSTIARWTKCAPAPGSTLSRSIWIVSSSGTVMILVSRAATLPNDFSQSLTARARKNRKFWTSLKLISKAKKCRRNRLLQMTSRRYSSAALLARTFSRTWCDGKPRRSNRGKKTLGSSNIQMMKIPISSAGSSKTLIMSKLNSKMCKKTV